MLLLAIALFAGTFILKDKIIQVLYHRTSDEVLSWNDYSSIIGRVKKIISLKGFEYLAKDFCGKVLYMGLSTFGIAYFGIAGCARKAFRSMKRLKTRQTSYTDFLCIYIFFIVIFQFLVALIYLNGASAPTADRLDNFLHGRYIDFFLPILIVTGIEEMLHGEKTYLGMVVTFIIYLPLIFVAYRVITGNDVLMRNAHCFTMIGMSFFLEKPLPDPVSYFIKQVLFSSGLTLLVDIVIILCRSLKQKMFVALVLVIQVLLGVKACTQFIFLNQSYIYEDIMVGDVLNDVLAKYPDKKVVHIYEGGVPYIQLVQFGSRATEISVIDAEYTDIDINQYLDDDTILITSECQDYADQVYEFYEENWILGHLRLNYNQ